MDEDDGEQIQEDDDEEFAVSSKPKQLGADVVRGETRPSFFLIFEFGTDVKDNIYYMFIICSAINDILRVHKKGRIPTTSLC